MLNVQVRGFFKQNCEVEQDGAPLTQLEHARREGGTFALGAEQYEIERGKRKQFSLSGTGGRYAGAELTGSRHWTITGNDGVVELSKQGMFSSKWDVTQDGRSLGTIRPHGFGRRFESDATLPAPLHVFAVYLVIVVARRSAAAASASSSGG